MRKENFVTSHLENRKKSQSSSDSLRTATERILARRRLPAHTESAWALVVFTKREGVAAQKGLLKRTLGTGECLAPKTELRESR